MSQVNPVGYFEIPVLDMKRAIKFYENIFGYKFKTEIIDNYEMALFPFSENKEGITGALAKGDVYIPSKKGTLVYFNTENISEILLKVKENGGKTLYPKTNNGNYGYVAEFEDSEGNRISLTEKV